MPTTARRPLTPVTTTRRPTYIGGPDGGRTRPEVWAAVSRETFPHPQTGEPMPVWSYERVDDVSSPWVVRYMPTGQWREFTSLPAGRAATADGSLLREFAAEDAAVMGQPCPGGCGRSAVAIVNTEGGPRPVCAVHRPVIEGRGFVTRTSQTLI